MSNGMIVLGEKQFRLRQKKTYEDCYSYIKVYFYTNDI